MKYRSNFVSHTFNIDKFGKDFKGCSNPEDLDPFKVLGAFDLGWMLTIWDD